MEKVVDAPVFLGIYPIAIKRDEWVETKRNGKKKENGIKEGD